MEFNIIDYGVIGLYLVIILFIGFWSGRRKKKGSRDYFLAGSSVPWWLITTSFVATGMNTEQLIGISGQAFVHGVVIANWGFIVLPIYTMLAFMFLPLYLRNRIATMPEFLGKRFNAASRNLFTAIILVSGIFINLATVLYGGALALQVCTGLDLRLGVLFIGVVAGVYTIYGGLRSVIWTDFIQFFVVFAGGYLLAYLGLRHVDGGLATVFQNDPGGMHLIQPADHPLIPWTALVLTPLGLGLYYSCANQALVQRGLAARSEWDARIAILVAGLIVFLKPPINFLPGMIARNIPEVVASMSKPDDAFPALLAYVAPVGVRGIVFAALIALIMSTVDSFLNSISTVFTLDFYKKNINRNASEKKLVKVGILTSTIVLLVAMVYAPSIANSNSIFEYFQMLMTFIATPIAVVMFLGVVWKRATPAAALVTMITGTPLAFLLRFVLGRMAETNTFVDSYLTNMFVQGSIIWVICMLIMTIVSLRTEPRKLTGIKSFLFKKETIFLPVEERAKRRSPFASIWFWWLVNIVVYAVVYTLLW